VAGAVDEKTLQFAVHAGAFGSSFFLSASDVNTLARGETDAPKPTPTGSMTLMLEIKQESNAGRINSGSTAESMKTQAFHPEVTSCHSQLWSPRQSLPVYLAKLHRTRVTAREET
jgi:hypothetical protein